MGMNEFKLQFYFNLYKDKNVGSRDKFRKEFKKKHGEFKYLPELIVQIENYQIKKYGETLSDFIYKPNTQERKIMAYKINEEQKRRLGKR